MYPFVSKHRAIAAIKPVYIYKKKTKNKPNKEHSTVNSREKSSAFTIGKERKIDIRFKCY